MISLLIRFFILFRHDVSVSRVFVVNSKLSTIQPIEELSRSLNYLIKTLCMNETSVLDRIGCVVWFQRVYSTVSKGVGQQLRCWVWPESGRSNLSVGRYGFGLVRVVFFDFPRCSRKFEPVEHHRYRTLARTLHRTELGEGRISVSVWWLQTPNKTLEPALDTLILYQKPPQDRSSTVRSLISCSAFLVNVLLVSAEPRVPPENILCLGGRYGTPPTQTGVRRIPPESFEISE